MRKEHEGIDIPIMLSVDGGYSYWAIRICDEAVVRGSDPESEEVEKAADSFDEFLSLLMNRKIRID
ncbi:MAG: SMI1/KNR4 family protein [Lachnospiraceae bacterium]|nr:SMI1/KNR4 family protein [Lachnospiraceae bacterium]MDE7200621.1 SMI1/KNR4 family protein [Lachnospiraceae bacterium]